MATNPATVGGVDMLVQDAILTNTRTYPVRVQIYSGLVKVGAAFTLPALGSKRLNTISVRGRSGVRIVTRRLRKGEV